jgi:hypothetical protein
MNRRITILMACRNIEESNFVGTRFVVAPRDLNRIARITNTDEVNSFYNATVVHVEAGDNAFS